MSDYRNVQTSVVDQDGRETCCACAVTAAHEWMLGEPLSIEDAFWQGKMLDPWANRAISAVRYILPEVTRNGHAIEPSWPYGMPAWPGPPPAASTVTANRRLVPAWRRIGKQPFCTLRGLLEAGALILTLAHVPSAWEDPSGVVHSVAGNPTQGRHAVVAVGDAEVGGHDVLIVRNSWGVDWGDRGYGYVTSSYVEHYLADAFIVERATA